VKFCKLLGNRKGIAPILAYLVLIPIVVSGGAATMAITQEIINDTQISSDIAIESVRILGYDIRDLSELRSHNGLYMKDNTAGIPDGLKSETERIAIYVQNDSVQKIYIDELRFVGTEYQFSGSYNKLDEFIENDSPAQGEYVILTQTPDELIDEGAVLPPGKLASVILGLDESFKIGRTAQLKITTVQGFVIVGTIIIGGEADRNSVVNVVTYNNDPDSDPESDPDPEPDPDPESDPDPEPDPEPECESVQITFEDDALGNPLPAGTMVNAQWHGVNIHISAVNDKPGHPNQAIIFDSFNPTGGDNDLGGPNWGVGNLPMDIELGNLLIIAEDAVDSNSDGLVDDPDDEAKGGIIFFQSTDSHCYFGFDLIDIEPNEANNGHLEINLDGGGTYEVSFNNLPGGDFGNHSVNRFLIIAEQLGDTFNEVEFHFNGSGAIDNLVFGG
jgi:hypothetical protein